jgi:hemerythrin-like metal-binding protein
MELFAWKPEYSVQNDTIDTQHKGLVSTINKLFEAMSTGKTQAQILPILKSLQSYTISHFSTEEAMMKKVSYPDFDNHQAQHLAFIDQVKTQMVNLEAGKQSVSIELLKFLREWLTQHILKVDKQYSPYLKP